MSDSTEGKDPHEPSMEEILASIRRIISEDAEAAEGEAAAVPKSAAPAAPPPSAQPAPPAPERSKRPLIADVDSDEDESDVLLLTEEMEEESPPPPFLREPAPALHEDSPLEPLRRAPEPLSFEAAPEPMAEAAASRDEAATLADRLLSDHAAAASLAAMSELLSRRQREPKIESLPMGNANQTLEDLTRELLRPILKTWLDDNLPQIVERIVREEIGRLALDAQRR
jgi:cell pole-organizing protein PopZ